MLTVERSGEPDRGLFDVMRPGDGQSSKVYPEESPKKGRKSGLNLEFDRYYVNKACTVLK
jgi:hypothetical protein